MADGSRGSLLAKVKRITPTVIKRALHTAWLRYLLERTVRRMAKLPEGMVPPQQLLRDLFAGWGNESFAADLNYLEALSVLATKTAGPILECGTGVTTILLALLAGRRGVEIWSLEDSREWFARIQSALSYNGLSGVHVCYAPLRDYDGYRWYDAPIGRMPSDFRLVICDGPPGDTLGGRYGLLPVMSKHLSRDAVVLMDDALRAKEMTSIEKWKQRWPLSVSIHESGHGAYAAITVLNPTPPELMQLQS